MPRRFPAQQPCFMFFMSREAFRRSHRGSLSSRSLAAPCPTTRTSSSRAALARPKTRESRQGEARGRPMQTRPGRTALHGALPTSAPGRSHPRAFSSLVCESIPFASDTLVASSGLVSVGARLGRESHALTRRPPRPVPRGLVKGMRIPDPGCLPSSVATRVPLAPKHERNHVAFNEARRSRDEDRRAKVNRPPFATSGLLRLRA